uniref:G-protein coupled receptors family 1 profile domain-containing protein n=1 Tax=Periophthalmus magnuspinnatus TaxID=409849 RepID=A0A3B4BJL1_9GOBI
MNCQVSHFTLGAYYDTGPLKWLYFVIILSVYILIVLSNLLLIIVICLNRTLHEPMYIFLCSLFMNELFGSTALFPMLLWEIIQDVHIITAFFCFLQIFLVHSYILNLAVMSYDRYVAICRPLQYRTIMTLNKAALFAVLIWIYSFIRCFITISLTLRLTLCGNFIDNLFCHNYLIVRLACSDTQLNNIYGFFATASTLLLPLMPILFSYAHILRVALSCPQKGRKAVHTCIPHIVSLLNFALGSFLDILQTRFNLSTAPVVIRIVFPLYFYVLQPILNPIMYGMKTSAIQTACKDSIKIKKIIQNRLGTCDTTTL